MRKVYDKNKIRVFMTGIPDVAMQRYGGVTTFESMGFATDFDEFSIEFIEINNRRNRLAKASGIKARPWEDIIKVNRKDLSTDKYVNEICRFEGVVIDIISAESTYVDQSYYVGQMLIDIYEEIHHVSFESYQKLFDWIMGILSIPFVSNITNGFNETLDTCLKNTVYDKTTNIAKALRRYKYNSQIHNVFFVFREMQDPVEDVSVMKEF